MENSLKKIFLYKDNARKNDVVTELCEKVIKTTIHQEYELHILDEENIKSYINFDLLEIDSNQFDFKIFNKDFLFLCIMYCHGGIIIYSDTVLSKNFSDIFILLDNVDLVVFGDCCSKIYEGFFMANKGALILKNLIKKYLTYTKNNHDGSILEIATNDLNTSEIMILDAEKFGYTLEKTLFGVSGNYIYQNCYFTNGVSVGEFFENTKGITKLQHTLAPIEYRNMPVEEFLNQDILLAKVFNKLLAL